MKKLIKHPNFKLFFSAALQVSMVAMNVTFISNDRVILMLLTGFGISLVWTFNVKSIAISTLTERVMYALGATFGTFIGYHIAHLL